MHIPDPPLDPVRIAEFTAEGYWLDTTSNDALEAWAHMAPKRLAIADGRVRLGFAEYYRRAERLAAHLVGLGLGADDVVAIQLPNWSEFAVALNAAMLAGIPFCQFHSDFRAREVEFILGFTEASALILPRRFRRFDYLEMLAGLRPKLPRLKHVMVVGEDVPEGYFDLRGFLDARESLDATGGPAIDDHTLRRRRPHANDLCRTAFTSGTTGDPKAVLHLHNTTNCAARFVNDTHRIGPDSVLLAFLPVGLNWGLLNVLQGIFAGCPVILQEVFEAQAALALIERERVTHFCCAPAHLVSLLERSRSRPLRSVLLADDHDRRRVLPDRNHPGGAGAAAGASPGALRHARMRLPVAHHGRGRPGSGVRPGRAPAAADGDPHRRR